MNINIGKRTQAYFVGFLIGIAIVSVLLDSRRDRSLEQIADVFTWERAEASVTDLPSEIVDKTGAQGWITAVAQYDVNRLPTGLKGYFFEGAEGKRYWWYGNTESRKLYEGTKFKVISRPGLEWDLMKTGFEHQGHKVISRRALAPEYILEIDVHSAIQMADAYENLCSKTNFVASVDWVEIDPSQASLVGK